MNGARTVLIVEDDPQVLKLVEQMLGSRPFRVLLAPRAAEAIEICTREPVHLLISDVNLPGLDGHRLAARVLELHPEARVLLISGFPREAAAVPANGRVRFLAKPFFPSQLLQHLRELLPEMD